MINSSLKLAQQSIHALNLSVASRLLNHQCELVEVFSACGMSQSHNQPQVHKHVLVWNPLNLITWQTADSYKLWDEAQSFRARLQEVTATSQERH